MAALVKKPLCLYLAALLLSATSPVLAQNSPAPRPLPGLDDFSLPTPRPTPRASPTPEPTTNPRVTATPGPVAPPRIVPTVRATSTATPRAAATPVRKGGPPTAVTPRPVATPTPRPLPAVAPVATPTAAATPAPTTLAPLPEPEASPLPQATPSPLPTVATPVPAQPAFALEPWMWQTLALVLATLAAAGIGRWWRKRGLRDEAEQRDDRSHEIFVFDTPVEPAALPPVPTPAPAPPPAPAPVPAAPTPTTRASLDLDLIPKRAGTNLLSASVEYAIVVRNNGAATASGVRLDVRLLSAGPRQDALIAALFGTPIAQPNTAPFDLPPGSAVELGGMAMHPKETLEVMEVGGRTLFVPVLTVNLNYDWEGGSGQTARSFVIGIDRGGDAKLQPFRLDAAARMYDTVGSLAYTAVVVR